MCQSINADILIDDSVRNCQSAASKGMQCFLLNRPYNINRSTLNNIIRINSFKEFYTDYLDLKNSMDY